MEYVSKFVDEDQKIYDDTPFVFRKDKSLKEKLPLLAKVFASILVQIAFDTEGNVPDCEYVMKASMKYRKSQDFISAFVSEMVERTNNRTDIGKNNTIRKRELKSEFDKWFTQEQGGRRKPNGDELFAYMDKTFGEQKKNVGWVGVVIKYPSNMMEMDSVQEPSQDLTKDSTKEPAQEQEEEEARLSILGSSAFLAEEDV